jgi:transposase
MGTSRRKFTLEFRTEAAHRVIDSGRSVPEVARELSIGEHSLSRWVREERRRIEAANASGSPPLTVTERERAHQAAPRALRAANRQRVPSKKQPRTSLTKPPSKKDSR